MTYNWVREQVPSFTTEAAARAAEAGAPDRKTGAPAGSRRAQGRRAGAGDVGRRSGSRGHPARSPTAAGLAEARLRLLTAHVASVWLASSGSLEPPSRPAAIRSRTSAEHLQPRFDPRELRAQALIQRTRHQQLSWRPCAAISPQSITRIRSASRTVDSRCAITNVVRPRASRSSAASTARSASISSEAVGSSRMTIGASFRNARARFSRWRCPPERRVPESRSTVSKSRGRFAMNSSQPASRAAMRPSSSVARGARSPAACAGCRLSAMAESGPYTNPRYVMTTSSVPTVSRPSTRARASRPRS